MTMSELLKLLKTYADSDYLPMHMPGHKRCMRGIGDPYKIDFTEIEGLDDLHHAEGILLYAQGRAAKMYQSEETHYLVNGSTAGILSAVAGCTTFGGTLLMARNSHKSVYHGALLKGLQTVYLYPQSMSSLGINGVILPEDVDLALRSNPEIQAVVITSPTYDGVVSDVEEIARITHSYGVPLIVDEAHGAHFPFSDRFPKDSVSCGADVVIHSLHKTLPALTQSALIHLNGPLIDRERIRKYLAVYQTSSPSYVLMAGIDECMEWVRTHVQAFEDFFEELMKFRTELRKMKSLELLKIPGMDLSRILLSVRHTGIHGTELAAFLREEHHIETEMACGTYVCAITTVMDTKRSLERFCHALFQADSRLCRRTDTENFTDEVIRTKSVYTLLQAEEAKKEPVLLKDACKRISGTFVMLYPPGIPLLAPGEIITEELLFRIRQYMERELEVRGIYMDRIWAVKEENGG